MEWMLKRFNELTVDQLYAILELRSEVFVVEQNCVYHDPDGKDQHAWHLMGFEADQLIAYTRIFAAGVPYPDPSIGRVVTSPLKRGSGLGRELMERSIKYCEKLFGKRSITLGAQLYLKKFYESLGFIVSGEEYIEDGIPHVTMTRKCTA
ncbi:MAG TPA: GNAT family N-acetyltransferase [Chitinophagaceae bacterium]|nr:GNAT family N-acetyltransferase [Chitinophagaceae bacterium]